MKIREKSLICLLMWMLLFSNPYISQRMNNIIILGIEICIFIWLVNEKIDLKIVRQCNPVIIFWMWTVMITIVNTGLSTRVINAFVTGLKYVLIFYIIILMGKKEYFKECIAALFKISSCLIVLVDLLIFLTKGEGIGGNDVLGNYIIGNKFVVAYFHLFFMSIFISKHIESNCLTKRKIGFLLLLLYSVFVCYYLECSTGVVGSLVFGMVVIFSWQKREYVKLLNNPLTFTTIFLGSTFLLVGTSILLNNPHISTLFMKYSHTGKVLSGRLEMFEITINAIKKRWLIGYGINCTIVEDTLTWGNPQNGLLKMLLDYGIIGTIIFLILCLKVLSGSNVKQNSQMILRAYPFWALAYGMAICSMVEICLNGFFFIALAFLCMMYNFKGKMIDYEIKK